jgi:hypothetical protein
VQGLWSPIRGGDVPLDGPSFSLVESAVLPTRLTQDLEAAVAAHSVLVLYGQTLLMMKDVGAGEAASW